MKERPILMSTNMVISLLNMLKTKTRRCNGLDKINENPDRWHFVKLFDRELVDSRHPFIYADFNDNDDSENYQFVKFPYGRIDDLLWVRESYCPTDSKEEFLYKANANGVHTVGKWKPGIHMVKDAARIWLQIESIEVERLHSISERDAQQEGASALTNMHPDLTDFAKTRLPNYRSGFAKVWFDINGIDSWKKNPWVWVIGFKILSVTGLPVWDCRSKKDGICHLPKGTCVQCR